MSSSDYIISSTVVHLHLQMK